MRHTVLAAAFVACAIAAPAQQQRKFTSGIDLVRVDALVTDGHSTISGLTASDFELRDNGVLQSIDSVLLESLPLSVTFVLNTSGSVNGIKLFNLERAVGAWLVHQSLTVIRVAFKDDLNLKPLLDRWRAEPWFTATAAMDRGLDLELYGAEFGLSTARRGTEVDVYDPDAFRQAEPFYRQAVAAHLEIAAVHLGRIELLRGRVDEARQLFEQAAYESHWRTTIYLANLFLGSVEEHDKEWTSAERRYKAAVAAIDTAQSGRLALAAFLGRNGRSVEAARLLADRPGEAVGH